MTHRNDRRIIHARALVADPASCADQPALRAWAWHVLRGRDLRGAPDRLSDMLARSEAHRLARIRARAAQLSPDAAS